MEVLNLSQRVVQILSKEIDKLSTEQLVKVCRVFLQRLVLGNNVGGNLDERTLSVLEAVGSVLLDAAKTRTTEGQLRSLFQEQSLVGENIDVIISFYNQHQETILNHISKIGISFSQIIGVDWRIDYSIRSKTTGKENVPMFFVSLKVLEPNDKVNNINFIANLEEMHDLLAKVRDAVKQVERVLNTEN